MLAVKKIREDVGMLQIELAKSLGVGQSTVSMWETGQSNPPIDKLMAMSKLFGCTVDELLGITGDSVSAG